MNALRPSSVAGKTAGLGLALVAGLAAVVFWRTAYPTIT